MSSTIPLPAGESSQQSTFAPRLKQKAVMVALLLTAIIIYARGFAWNNGEITPTILGTTITGFLTAVIILVYSLLRQLAICRIGEEVLYLAAEISNEAGPDSKDLTQAYFTYRELIDFLDKVRFRGVSGLICRALLISPATIKESLVNTGDAIAQAQHLDTFRRNAQAIARFCEQCYDSFGSLFHKFGYKLFALGPLSAKEVEQIIEAFLIQVVSLRSNPSFNQAKLTCLLSRKAGFFILCAGGYTLPSNLIHQVAIALDECHDEMVKLQATCPEVKEALVQYCVSVKRRRATILAVAADDGIGVWRVLASGARINICLAGEAV